MFFEAESYIKAFCLKKHKKITYADVFENDKITLIVSGVGGLNSAINLVRFFSDKTIFQNDMYINIGVCGCTETAVKIGTVFLINKIKSSYTGRCFYPDIIYKHSFKEASLETFAKPSAKNNDKFILSDMEAAELFVCVSQFFKLHQIAFLKIVSDYNNPKNVTREFINKITDNKNIYDFINILSQSGTTDNVKETAQKYTNHFSAVLKLTESMKNDLFKLFMYYILCGNDLSVLDNFSIEEINDKNLSKKYFSKLKSILLQEEC